MKKLIFSLCAIALLASCGTKKRLPKVEPGEVVETLTNAEKTSYETMVAKSFDFENLSAKAKYSFNGASLSGKFFVEHGKRIAMTMTVLGIEVVRIEADAETITLVDKFDKMYTQLSVSEFAEQFGMKDEMRLDALECLMLGRMFVPGVGEAKEKDVRHFDLCFDTAGALICRMKKDKYDLNYYSTPVEDKVLAGTEVIARRGAKEGNISCEYSGHVSLGNGLFPTTETISMKHGDQTLKATLSLSAPVINTKALAPFKPSAAYRQVSISEFIEAIKNISK